MKILTLDIGGTAVKYGLFCNRSEESARFGQFPVLENGIEAILAKICDFARQHRPDFISVSAPGPFDFESGTSRMQHKLPSLYRVSLRRELQKVLPRVGLCFVHDSVAFAVGAMHARPALQKESFAAVMLGTGLGYLFVQGGKACLNSDESPAYSLWNQPFSGGITEDFVSTRALLKSGRLLGFSAENVYELAQIAQNGEEAVRAIFSEYGRNLAIALSGTPDFEQTQEVVIGGQISRSWNLMQSGFESVCPKKYTVLANPAECALWGLYDCAVFGKDQFFEILEESR